jgi:hypothetical protein
LKEDNSDLEHKLKQTEEKFTALQVEFDTFRNQSKHQIKQEVLEKKEMELGFRTSEQRNLQNTEINIRKYEDIIAKHESELEEVQNTKQETIEQLNDTF